jgi:hypothetical protein
VGQLPAVATGNVVAAAERRGERREPARVRRVRVLAREDECLPAREVRAQVPRAAVAELRRVDLVDARAEPACGLDAPVA